MSCCSSDSVKYSDVTLVFGDDQVLHDGAQQQYIQAWVVFFDVNLRF